MWISFFPHFAQFSFFNLIWFDLIPTFAFRTTRGILFLRTFLSRICVPSWNQVSHFDCFAHEKKNERRKGLHRGEWGIAYWLNLMQIWSHTLFFDITKEIFIARTFFNISRLLWGKINFGLAFWFFFVFQPHSFSCQMRQYSVGITVAKTFF